MQTRNKVLDDISQLMTNAMGVAQGAREEAELWRQRRHVAALRDHAQRSDLIGAEAIDAGCLSKAADRSQCHRRGAAGHVVRAPAAHWPAKAATPHAGGLIMSSADAHRLPAGGALAVDREPFAETVTARLRALPNVQVSGEEITELPDQGHWIFATGPLTSATLAQAIAQETGADALAFFDAIAPIVYFDSIDMSQAWMQSRYDKGETEEERTAYLNCPMTRDQYEAFIDQLLAADKTEFREGETAGYFDGCLPIEVMADRGRETLRHGPMKPVGLTNPHQPDVKPHRRQGRNSAFVPIASVLVRFVRC